MLYRARRQLWWIAGAWSLAVHAALLGLMTLAILERRAPSGGIGLTTQLTLDADQDAPPARFDDSDWSTGASLTFLAEREAAVTPATFLDREPPSDPTRVLPAVADTPATPSAAAPLGAASASMHRTRTAIFGVPGEGSKFVYVFDRSASTGGPPYNTLAAAKAQLIASIDGLGPMHQFQIVFYNQTPTVFTPSQRSWGLCFATPQNKLLARKFIGSITPDGSTNHAEALRVALGLRPDVIFLLTDGDPPQLSPEQLETIRRAARGVSINAIEFGVGPQPAADNFLLQLARQNAGLYGYLDLGRLPPQ
jgi:hypothetical protein